MLTYVTTFSRTTKQAILFSLDVLLVPVSLIAAMALSLGEPPNLAQIQAETLSLVLLSVTAAALSLKLGLPRIQLKSYEVSALALSAVVAAILAGVLAALYQTGYSLVEPGTPIIMALLYTVLSGAVRFLLLQILVAIYRYETPAKRVLIYGAGNTGVQLARALSANEMVRVIGFVDDNPVLNGMTVAGKPVYPAKSVAQIVQDEAIERVLLAMPSLSAPRQAQIARRIAQMNVEVQSLPSFAQLIGEEEIVNRLTPVLPTSVLGREHLQDELDGGGAAYSQRVVLVSGAGGSIGSELCRQLLFCKPKKLVLLEQTEFTLFSIERTLTALVEGTECEIVPVLGSVTDARLVRDLLETHGVQVVLHAAAYKHVPMVELNPLAGIENNVFGTLTIAQAACDLGIERFVLVSTDKAVRPRGVMGATKRLAEILVSDLARRSGSTVLTMVRFGNVLGSSGSVVPIFQEQVSRGGPVTVTDPNVTRYFMTIQEACRLVLWAGTLSKGGEIFVLDMGAPIRIAELAKQVIEASGYTVRDADTPDGDIEIIITGLRQGEKLEEELSLSKVLTPSSHPKLSTAKEVLLSEFEIARAVQGVKEAVDARDPQAALDEISRWIERDVSRNDIASQSETELEI